MKEHRFVPAGEHLPCCLQIDLGSRLWDEVIAGRWWHRLQSLHQQLFAAYGVPLPETLLRFDESCGENIYRLRFGQGISEEGQLHPGMWFATGEPELVELLLGEPAFEPIFGLEGRWIEESRAGGAEQLGCQLLSPEALWVGHLSQRLECNLGLCLSLDWLQRRLRPLGLARQARGLFPYLQSLLQERVGVGQLEVIADAYRSQPRDRLAAIRRALGAAITAPWVNAAGELPVVSLADGVAHRLASELKRVDGPESWFLGLFLRQLQQEVEWGQEALGEVGLLVPGHLRRPIFELLPASLRRVPVLTYEEIPVTLDCPVVAWVGSRLHPLAHSWPCKRYANFLSVPFQGDPLS